MTCQKSGSHISDNEYGVRNSLFLKILDHIIYILAEIGVEWTWYFKYLKYKTKFMFYQIKIRAYLFFLSLQGLIHY